jgi:hypothetical protein
MVWAAWYAAGSVAAVLLVAWADVTRKAGALA